MRSRAESGFVLVYVVLLIFVLALAGAVVLADYQIKSFTRQAASGVSAESVYKAITGNTNTEQYGYLGDVGDYPTKLSDLLAPNPVPAGWNGPYLTNATLDNGKLVDSYGSPVEFFLSLSAGSLDRLAIVSRGPDKFSSNVASDPNVASAPTPFPGDAGYPSASGNTDNVIYPDFISDTTTVNYQNAGTLAYNITNFNMDALQNAMAPGCPGLYTLKVASAARGNSDMMDLQYSPGLNTTLGQGVYIVSLVSALAKGVIATDRVNVGPGASVARNLVSLRIDGSVGVMPTFTLSVVNNASSSISILKYSSVLGSVGTGTSNSHQTFTVTACASMSAQIAGSTIDTWTMPYGNYTRYIGNTPQDYTLTITNNGTQTDQVKVVQATGLLLGTVYKRKATAINIPQNPDSHFSPPSPGVVVNLLKKDGTALSPPVSLTITGNTNYTVP